MHRESGMSQSMHMPVASESSTIPAECILTNEAGHEGADLGLQAGQKGPEAQQLHDGDDAIVHDRGVQELQPHVPGIPHPPPHQLDVRLVEQRRPQVVDRPRQPAPEQQSRLFPALARPLTSRYAWPQAVSELSCVFQIAAGASMKRATLVLC
jgi:hypothetical protein